MPGRKEGHGERKRKGEKREGKRKKERRRRRRGPNVRAERVRDVIGDVLKSRGGCRCFCLVVKEYVLDQSTGRTVKYQVVLRMPRLAAVRTRYAYIPTALRTLGRCYKNWTFFSVIDTENRSYQRR